MIKYVIHIILILVFVWLTLIVVTNTKRMELPSFIKQDSLVQNRSVKTNLTFQSFLKPTQYDSLKFVQDYENAWAHLNYLYGTNDAEEGKEYYTEDFFKQICTTPNKLPNTYIKRKDILHNVTITHWSWDGLLCIGVDSNLALEYKMLDTKPYYTKSNISFVFQLQGNHWRIHALNFIQENKHSIQ